MLKNINVHRLLDISLQVLKMNNELIWHNQT